MRRGILYAISAAGVALVLASASLAAWWLVRDSSEVQIAVLDKTVPNGNLNEHGAFFWLLQRYKVLNGGAIYRRSRDFIGTPTPNSLDSESLDSYRLSPDDLKSKDFFYLADGYGVSHARGHSGGLNSSEADSILAFEKSGGAAILEYNAFDWPTEDAVRRKFEERLGVEGTCWTGRFYEDLNDAPRRYKDVHLMIAGEKWDRPGPGVLLICGERAIGLSIGRELGPGGIEIINGAPRNWAMIGADLAAPYYYWFQVLNRPQNSQARVLAHFRLDTTEAGRQVLSEAGIPGIFPAIIHAQSGRQLFYFAGDFSESSPPAWSAFVPGADMALERWAFLARRPGQSRFFWGIYRPVVLNILQRAAGVSLSVRTRSGRQIEISAWDRLPLMIKFLVAIIWILVFSLAFFILIIMVLKVFHQFGDSWITWRKDRFQKHVQDLLGGVKADYASVFGPQLWGDSEAVEELLLELIQKVKGPLRDQITGIFESVGIVDRRITHLNAWRAWRRAAAADKLGRMGSRKAIVPLLRLLNDPEPSVRLVAVEAIGAVRDPGTLKFLLERLGKEAPHAKWRVARAIVGFGEEAVDELLEILQDPDSPSHAHAASLLGEIRSQRARTALENLSRHSKEVSSRVAALTGLGRLGDPRSLPIVLLSLESQNSEERKSAAEALGRLGDANAVQALSGSLADNDWWVRVKAAEALALLGENGVKALQAGLASDSDEVRTLAREMLELTG